MLELESTVGFEIFFFLFPVFNFLSSIFVLFSLHVRGFLSFLFLLYVFLSPFSRGFL